MQEIGISDKVSWNRAEFGKLILKVQRIPEAEERRGQASQEQ